MQSLALLTILLTAPRFWGALEPGPHAVGFQVITAESLPGSAGWQPRPIEIATWYPAAATEQKAMTFGEYFEQAKDLKRRSASLAVAITGDAAGVSAETEKHIAASPMLERRDAARCPVPSPS